MARQTNRGTVGRSRSLGGDARASTTGEAATTGGSGASGGGGSASLTGRSAATGAPGTENTAIGQLSDAIQAILDEEIPEETTNGLSPQDAKAFIKVLHRIRFDKQAV